MSDKETLVCYSDGSSQPNPGYAGYGLYGYILKPAKKSKSINYPLKTGFVFTSKGIAPKGEVKEEVEVMDIFSEVGCIHNHEATNNQAELLGLIKAMTLAFELSHRLNKLVLISDSRYALGNLESHVEKWRDSDWRTSTGTPVVNMDLWQQALNLKEKLAELGISIEFNWVKGHEEELGNIVVDMYANVGTNFSRKQYKETTDLFVEILHRDITPITQFKKDLEKKHIIYDYKTIYFSTGPEQRQSNIQYLNSISSPSTDEDVGKRNLDSVYAVLINGVSQRVKDLEDSFSAKLNGYNVRAMINIDTLKSDKLLFRLIDKVGFEPILNHHWQPQGTHQYKLMNTTGIIVKEVTKDFCFIMDTLTVYTLLEDATFNKEDYKAAGMWFDLTDNFYDKEAKALKIKFTDSLIDLTEQILPKGYEFVGKPIVNLGKDIPAFTTLRSIEKTIEEVSVVVECVSNKNLATLIFCITYKDDDGNICHLNQTNLKGKYLIRPI